MMDNKLIDRIFRDKISSILLIITFAICILSLYNFSDIMGKYQLNENIKNKYKNVYSGCVRYDFIFDEFGSAFVSGEDAIKNSEVWSLIKGIEVANAPKKWLYIKNSFSPDEPSVTYIFDFSTEYSENIDIYYDKRKGIPGVYISQGLKNKIETEGETKYIHLNGEKYLVKAVYKDFTYDHDDYKIVIPWKSLNKNQKDYYINLFRDRIMDMNGLGIDIESDEDINDELIFINNLYKKNNLILDIDHSPDNEKSFLIHSGTGIIMIIFSMFNTLVVTGMWVIRRRKELMIKKTWGMSEGMIYIRTFLELSRHLIASIPVMIIFQLVYMIIFKETVTFNLYKYAYLFFGLIIILSLVSYAALLRIRKLKPAEGLRGE